MLTATPVMPRVMPLAELKDTPAEDYSPRGIEDSPVRGFNLNDPEPDSTTASTLSAAATLAARAASAAPPAPAEDCESPGLSASEVGPVEGEALPPAASTTSLPPAAPEPSSLNVQAMPLML